MQKEKFALIVPHIVSRVERELIEGVSAYLKTRNCALFVITGISNFTSNRQQDAPFIHGIHNSYRLLENVNFDGVLFAAGDFVIDETKDHIYEMLRRTQCPALVIEEEHDGFPSIYPEQEIAFERITHHLIWEHDCRKLYFLAGAKGNYVSEKRQAGFVSAMRKNGLSVTEDMIFYGDFWVDKPALLAKDIADGSVARPDAVVCASDMMAISLTDALMQHGIRVPEDIKVTGCDGITEALLHDPPLTTITGRSYQLGYGAAARLYHRIHPDCIRSGMPAMRQKLHIGTSCGCTSAKTCTELSLLSEMRHMNAFHLERYRNMATGFFRAMTDVRKLEELMLQTAMFSYRIPNWNSMYVCLCEDWTFDFTDPKKYRECGFSENTLCALEKYRNDATPAQICARRYPTAELLPPTEQECPIYLITSLHNCGQIYGFFCTGYQSPEDIFLDDNYTGFCEALCRGIQEVEHCLYREYVQSELEQHFDKDPETGFLSRKGLEQQLSARMQHAEGYGIILIKMEHEKHVTAFDPLSMLPVAIRETAQEAELTARLDADVFAVAFPAQSIGTADLTERMDLIENEILFRETDNVRMTFPLVAVTYGILESLDKISGQLSDLLEKLQRHFHHLQSDPTDYRRMLPEIRRQIKRDFRVHMTADDAAKQMHISRSHFGRLYLQVFGISFHNDIIRIRLDRARYLLTNTNMRVNEIADQCGYENVSHFMRQFRNRFGMTAMEFRKKN